MLKKILKKVGWSLSGVLVISLLIFFFCLGTLTKIIIENTGSDFLGTPVKIKSTLHSPPKRNRRSPTLQPSNARRIQRKKHASRSILFNSPSTPHRFFPTPLSFTKSNSTIPISTTNKANTPTIFLPLSNTSKKTVNRKNQNPKANLLLKKS